MNFFCEWEKFFWQKVEIFMKKFDSNIGKNVKFFGNGEILGEI